MRQWKIPCQWRLWRESPLQMVVELPRCMLPCHVVQCRERPKTWGYCAIHGPTGSHRSGSRYGSGQRSIPGCRACTSYGLCMSWKIPSSNIAGWWLGVPLWLAGNLHDIPWGWSNRPWSRMKQESKLSPNRLLTCFEHGCDDTKTWSPPMCFTFESLTCATSKPLVYPMPKEIIGVHPSCCHKPLWSFQK